MYFVFIATVCTCGISQTIVVIKILCVSDTLETIFILSLLDTISPSICCESFFIANIVQNVFFNIYLIQYNQISELTHLGSYTSIYL